jgi:dihydrolipoamide dehydrogenase
MGSYDLAIIGAGPGGYVAAIRAAQLGFSVACIEKGRTLGGTCLNIGCIPSKTLLHSSELFETIQKGSRERGITFNSLTLELPLLMKHKEKVVEKLVEGIAFLFKKNKVTRIEGEARFVTPHQLEIISETQNKETLEARNFIIASGSEPISLPFLPFDEKTVLSSTGALSLASIPKKLILIGAGIIGLELGSVFSRLGCEVTILELMDRICPSFDVEISRALFEIFRKKGLKLFLSTQVTGAQIQDNSVQIEATKEEQNLVFEGDAVLIAIGRKPVTKNLGLEAIGIEMNKGQIRVNSHFQTNHAHIYAIGDVIDGPMLAHKASEEGIAVVNFLASIETPPVLYPSIPNVMYTQPEVAYVGITEQEAKNADLETRIGRFPFQANARARCTGEELGFVKIIGEATTDRMIGLHIVGPYASEMIGEGVFAIQKKMTLKEIAHASHGHPTYCEAIKEAALNAHKEAIHI